VLEDLAELFRAALAEVGASVSLQEEITLARHYLAIEELRFGKRLAVQWEIDPRVHEARVPSLVLQPLVENAVRHGLEGKDAPGHISIIAEDHDAECVLSVEDDGLGEDPERIRQALAGDVSFDSVGLGNVDERLRSTFGDEYGLVVETAPGAGTKVVVRVPKFAPGVQA